MKLPPYDLPAAVVSWCLNTEQEAHFFCVFVFRPGDVSDVLDVSV